VVRRLDERSTGPRRRSPLYWEPLDADLCPVFAEHRDEISDFADRAHGGSPSFAHMSYSELWQSWAADGGPDLIAHVENLRARYAVRAFAAEDPDETGSSAAMAR
jgi:hypothetical protein